MKEFNKMGAQGDICFMRIEKLPDGLIEQPPVDGKIVVAHSETGHHHAMELLENPQVRAFVSPDSPMKLWLDVQVDTVLKHFKTYDIHESVMFRKGLYEIRRQRENTPKGLRKVQD